MAIQLYSARVYSRAIQDTAYTLYSPIRRSSDIRRAPTPDALMVNERDLAAAAAAAAAAGARGEAIGKAEMHRGQQLQELLVQLAPAQAAAFARVLAALAHL